MKSFNSIRLGAICESNVTLRSCACKANYQNQEWSDFEVAKVGGGKLCWEEANKSRQTGRVRERGLKTNEHNRISQESSGGKGK